MTSDDIYKTAERYGDPFTGWMFNDAGLARFARQIAEQAKSEEQPPKLPHECATEAEKVAYCAGWWAALEANGKAPRRLTDSEIGKLWFDLKLHGVPESAARIIVRATESKLRAL